MLADPAARAATIGEIAARSGFTPTWFSSVFKARSGEGPREFRQRGLAEPVEPGRRGQGW
ncbi:helix-turn-helix transcriptional regulator [Allokutzneria oryzae]|uniref:Helix-turn-helix transcriptional regulator n=1 Tax=Allokutzneria oryzae TaxID=1378989 RepID=A0ABV5ZV47_9PSEU